MIRHVALGPARGIGKGIFSARTRQSLRKYRSRSLRLEPGLLLLLAIAVAPPSRVAAQETGAADSIAAARRESDAKRFDQAAAILEAVLLREPDHVAALSLLARVQAWSGRYDASIATYRRLLALQPDDPTSRAGYARALAWSGRHRESIREFRRAIRGDSTNLETRVGYARALSWSGDLPGAAEEYRRILDADPRHGDAWLGLATVARWRGAPTASDRYLERAEARGADASALEEERTATRTALRPATGVGWMRARERQYVEGRPAFTLESVGPFAQGRATLGRTLGLAARFTRLHRFQTELLGANDSLNYDFRSSVFDGDLRLLRYDPIQLSAGATLERLERRSAGVRFPLGGEDEFFGARARVWGYWGRLTPSLGARRDFLPIKVGDSSPGARALEAGGVTNVEGSLAWAWSGNGSARGSFARGIYSDDNERTTVSAGAAYRIRTGRPNVRLDYTAAWTDFDFRSSSYFTPLESVKHLAGISAAGYSERGSLDYGLRYELAYVLSENFDDITTNAWSAYADGVLLGTVPLGIEASYSVDNNDYRMWGLTLSGSVRW